MGPTRRDKIGDVVSTVAGVCVLAATVVANPLPSVDPISDSIPLSLPLDKTKVKCSKCDKTTTFSCQSTACVNVDVAELKFYSSKFVADPNAQFWGCKKTTEITSCTTHRATCGEKQKYYFANCAGSVLEKIKGYQYGCY